MKKNTNSSKTYYVNKKEFNIPNLGFDIKITNFKDSNIEKNDKINELYDNSVNDLFNFLFSIFNLQKIYKKSLKREVVEFIKNIIPKNIKKL